MYLPPQSIFIEHLAKHCDIIVNADKALQIKVHTDRGFFNFVSKKSDKKTWHLISRFSSTGLDINTEEKNRIAGILSGDNKLNEFKEILLRNSEVTKKHEAKPSRKEPDLSRFKRDLGFGGYR